MEVLDTTNPAGRLRWEDKEYRLRLQSNSPLEKYPGWEGSSKSENIIKLMISSETTCEESPGEIGCRRWLDLPVGTGGTEL